MSWRFSKALLVLQRLHSQLMALQVDKVNSYVLRKGRRIWRLTRASWWRVLSLLLAFVSVLALGGAIVLVGATVGQDLLHDRPTSMALSATPDPAAVTRVSIPVRFLPDYDVERGSDGAVTKTLKYGRGAIETTSDRIALVMIDTWEYSGDPMPEPVGRYSNIAALLEEAQAHGVTVIHAPSHPVVDKYPQYHALRREVEAFLERRPLAEELTGMVPEVGEDGYEQMIDWPPPEFRHEVDGMREEALEEHYLGRPPGERDIAWFLRPREGEFVVQSSDELRYVLWKKGIFVLLYVGGATNECMLHRPAGVLNLVGSDYVIVLLGDCTAPTPSPWCENSVVQRVFEDYYARTAIGGYVADSQDIVWNVAD
jgi:nicotinamidase-related amidase